MRNYVGIAIALVVLSAAGCGLSSDGSASTTSAEPVEDWLDFATPLIDEFIDLAGSMSGLDPATPEGIEALLPICSAIEDRMEILQRRDPPSAELADAMSAFIDVGLHGARDCLAGLQAADADVVLVGAARIQAAVDLFTNEVAPAAGSNSTTERGAFDDNPMSTPPEERVETALSSECEASMQAAAAEPDGTLAQPLIEATLTACTSVEEWLAGLRKYPDVLGVEPDFVGELDLKAACGTAGDPSRRTPVCTQAAAGGG